MSGTLGAKMKLHSLKTREEHFRSIIKGTKRFELRKNDRDFNAEDVLHLREWNKHRFEYTGRSVCVKITSILKAPNGKDHDFGLKAGHVIMSIILEDQEMVENANETKVVPFGNSSGEKQK